MDTEFTCFIKYNNLTADSVTLTPGERIAHLELLDAASNQQIDSAGEPLFQYMRRILTPTSDEMLSEPESRVDRLDLGDTPPDNIDFSKPHCQSDFISRRQTKVAQAARQESRGT